jgi:predicted PurR-regulated permease PerM
MTDIQPVTAKSFQKYIPALPGTDIARGMSLFVMIVATLYFGKEVLIPITLALLLAFILAPLVSLLRGLYLGRVPAVLLGMVVAVSIILGIGGVIGAQISELSTNMPQYAETIETKIKTTQHYVFDRATVFASHIGVQAPALSAHAVLPGADKPHTHQTLSEQGIQPLELVQRYISPLLSQLGDFVIILVVTIFTLLQQEDLRDRLIRVLGSDDLHRTTLAIDDGARRLSKYFLTQLCVNTVFGMVITIGLMIIGIPNPMLFGILSALLRFVPYIGSMISALLPLSLAAAVDPGWSMMAWTSCLYIVVEGATGQFIEPMTYGHSTGLSPFSVVVAAIFWSWLWGPTGLILSTPLTLCLVVMGRHVKRLEFLDILLGDRPALTPIESFYQRLLAGDADEAQDQAELLLKDRTLTVYYDEVAVKGLQLAANDAQRGALSHEQLRQIQETIKSLIDGLNGYQDKPPAPPAIPAPESDAMGEVTAPPLVTPGELSPWRDPRAIMCIAGRGPLDEATASILAQLLDKNGIGAHVISYAEASRQAISMLDMAGVRMACVVCLDIIGSPAHLRYLMHRLRYSLPAQTPILIGMWSADDEAFHDKAMRAHLGADYFSSSLHAAVGHCLEESVKGTALTV